MAINIMNNQFYHNGHHSSSLSDKAALSDHAASATHYDQDYDEELAAMSESTRRQLVLQEEERLRYQRAAAALFQGSPHMPTPRRALELEEEERQRQFRLRRHRQLNRSQTFDNAITLSSLAEEEDQTAGTSHRQKKRQSISLSPKRNTRRMKSFPSSSDQQRQQLSCSDHGGVVVPSDSETSWLALYLEDEQSKQQQPEPDEPLMPMDDTADDDNSSPLLYFPPTTNCNRGYQFIEDQRQELKELNLEPGAPNPLRQKRQQINARDAHITSRSSPTSLLDTDGEDIKHDETRQLLLHKTNGTDSNKNVSYGTIKDENTFDRKNNINREDDSREGGGRMGDTVASASDVLSSSIKTCLSDEVKEPVLVSVLYGLINIAIVLPVLMSFATIIYKHSAFRPYMPGLVKLTVLSGAIHQLCFSSLSSLPFAVGQVQDAGLIFLSSMATTIVEHCHSKGLSDKEMLATSTILLSLCTATLGIGVVLIAKCRLATYVQMLPTPVVGGYLAYIGFFCGQAGLGLMANITIDNLLEWKYLFDSRVTFFHILPGLLGGLLIYVMINKIQSMFVLPGCIIGMILGFYLILYISHTSVEDAQQHDWIAAASASADTGTSSSSDETVSSTSSSPSWSHTWDYLQFHLVDWSVLPKLIFTLISMIAVVALSSSLDVMAIEIELGYPLDINHELMTVGWSNVVSGLTGGYTGSYIFSQSIFSLRAGIRRRINGWVVAICELLVVFVLPFSPLEYVPTFFFGSLLIMIALDLMVEWLWLSKQRMTYHEYVLNLLTFGLIQVLNVEYGIIAGLVVYIIASKWGANVGQLSPSSSPSS